MPDEDVFVREVQAKKTQSGNTRYVLVDEQGREFTTFKEQIAKDAVAAEGKRARIRWHEQERNGFTNVYLDRVEPLEEEAVERVEGVEGVEGHAEGDPVDEVAWNATIEAAPWLLGTSAPKTPVPPKEVFEKLQPFKELVADDIRSADGEEEAG
jgi:hypothetical protein